MGLKTKITVALLVIATALGGVYCFISAFYAPYFFRDTFFVEVHIKKNPSDDLSKKDPFFHSYFYAEEKKPSLEIPDDSEQLKQLLNEGRRIGHRFKGHTLPIWIRKNESPVIPCRYRFNDIYFERTQKSSSVISPGSHQFWGLIIPHFDCELAFIIISSETEDIFVYPTGIHREDMMKVRQKNATYDRNYNQINIPTLKTLKPASKPILDFMMKDDTLKLFLKRTRKYDKTGTIDSFSSQEKYSCMKKTDSRKIVSQPCLLKYNFI